MNEDMIFQIEFQDRFSFISFLWQNLCYSILVFERKISFFFIFPWDLFSTDCHCKKNVRQKYNKKISNSFSFAFAIFTRRILWFYYTFLVYLLFKYSFRNNKKIVKKSEKIRKKEKISGKKETIYRIHKKDKNSVFFIRILKNKTEKK